MSVQELIEEAGRIALSHWRGEVEVANKAAPGEAVDLVSAADLAVDAYLREGLARLAPGVGIVSEEGEGSAPWGEGDAFVIDPIDGTHNFLAGTEWWTIVLARTRGHEVEEAWIHHPPSGETTHGVRGRTPTHAGQPLEVSGGAPREGLVSLSLSQELVPLLLGSDRFAGLRALGSHAMCLSLTAQGRFLLYAGGGKPWDVAAGFLLVEQAGGRVCNLDGSRRSPFDPGPGLAGAPQGVEAALELFPS